MIYGCPQKSLREYSQDNRRYGFVNLPPEEHRLRDMEIGGSDSIEEQPEDPEEEMNLMFNQSILETGEGGPIGRLSISHKSGNQSTTDTDLDFQSHETEASVRAD